MDSRMLERMYESMVAGAENAMTTLQTRASRLVAEALVEGHEPSQIADRAQELGLPQPLTKAVVAACCGQQTTSMCRTGNATPSDGCCQTQLSD